jgi:hypothetical protein
MSVLHPFADLLLRCMQPDTDTLIHLTFIICPEHNKRT